LGLSQEFLGLSQEFFQGSARKFFSRLGQEYFEQIQLRIEGRENGDLGAVAT
jgi:hypothetical protein